MGSRSQEMFSLQIVMIKNTIACIHSFYRKSRWNIRWVTFIIMKKERRRISNEQNQWKIALFDQVTYYICITQTQYKNLIVLFNLNFIFSLDIKGKCAVEESFFNCDYLCYTPEPLKSCRYTNFFNFFWYSKKSVCFFLER